MKYRVFLLVFSFFMLPSVSIIAQVATWDFTGISSPATAAATFFHPFLDSSSNITRGPGAAASAAVHGPI